MAGREPTKTNDGPARIAQLEDRCRDLEARLRWSNEKLQERSGRLYELERHYASEHFELAESMRNLKIERFRNAGTSADRDIILLRAKQLQIRIAELKVRLRRYEEVEDLFFDGAPIVADDA
jgi:chromosome segregation ATPase